MLEVTLYPTYSEVFATSELEGVFYPLCTITTASNEQLHFVSHNGMWIDEEVDSQENNSQFTRFSLQDGKYVFAGKTTVYKGYEVAKQVYPIIAADFTANGIAYLNSKKKTGDYIDEILPKLCDINIGDFDVDYYLQTFYEYSINKADYQRSGRFGRFRQVIDGWGKADESDYVYTDLEGLDTHCDAMASGQFEAIGYTIGSEFFTDGNDNCLYYDKQYNGVLLVNHYG